ncbi:tkl protein kinase [Phytophthora cinnamomi]|uniref:tkl protein kinase n=1 Tax=Phytophthora cinnamomi TaxID=4785 RepID=UPI00355AB6D6|nr:tkl protein kinase [Phytophthora cinnamomi]
MLRKARSVGLAVATLTPLAALAVGEAAQQYDDSNKVVYAKQQLLKWRSASETQANSDESKVTMPGASAWLGSAPPKFPYLLSISAGDNPAVVTNTLLDGAKVLGSYDESTRDTLKRLTTPTSSLEVALRSIAARYSELKSTLHGRLPEDFDPRVGLKANAEDMMMDALLDALRDLQYAEQEYGAADEEREGGLSPISQNGRVTALPVFLLRDFDGFSDQDAEKWLRWTHQISSEGLAHVVLLTTSTVTPSKMEWIQARHQSGQNADSGGSQDFVAILLRPANGLVDQTSAKEKLREILKSNELDLVSDESEATNAEDQSSFDQPTIMSASQSDQRTAEMEIILKVAGNWWSDIDAICQRLMDSNLNDVTLHEERVGVIQEVCHNFLQDTETRLLEALHLDGSLQLPRNYSAGYHSESTSASASLDPIETSKAFSALETWKCLETLVDVTPVTGGNALIGSPQQLLKQKNKTPLNCVSPVEALLPFNYRDEGEQKFLDLIDQQVLFLRPKDVVEIGVIPCKKSALVSPCWVQTRPVIKKAFEKIHRSDTYFRVILDLDRFAANIEMRKEIEQYEQEIAERRQALSDMKRDFAILQFSMTPAEKAQRKAELALIDVELQAKDVYLEKLRSLLTL